MLKIFKAVDMFGVEFHFLIKSSSQYHTITGGILSIFSIIIVFTLIFCFGRDMWFRLNPKISESVQLKNEYTPLSLEKNKIFFAFALRDLKGDFIELNKTIYLSTSFISIDLSNTSQRKATIYEKEKIKKCSDYNITVNEQQTHSFDNYYCLNASGYEIFGGFEFEKFSYFSVKLSYCPKGIQKYDSKVCASPSEIQDLTKDAYITYFIPQTYIDPKNYSHPASTTYTLKHVELAGNQRVSDNIYFTEIKIKEEKCVIKKENYIRK